MTALSNFIKNLVTENDGTSYCTARIIGIVAASIMMYKFAFIAVPDYISFAAGITAICSSIAANKYVEKKNAQLP
jgi:predicted tellurium resistance membrane protein TerC